MKNRIKTAFSLRGSPYDEENRFVTSGFVRSLTLAIIRATLALYIFTDIFFVLIWTCTHASEGGCLESRRSFSYFTVLSFWGQGFYFLAAAIHTFAYAQAPTQPSLLSRMRRPFAALHSLLYASVVVFPWIVTVVFWVAIYKGPWYDSTFDSWRNISQHALNAGFALSETLLANTRPISLIQLFWLVVILMAYLGVAYITNADQDFFVYKFLNESSGGRAMVAAYILGIAALLIILVGLVNIAICLRQRHVQVMIESRRRATSSNPSVELEAVAPSNKIP